MLTLRRGALALTLTAAALFAPTASQAAPSAPPVALHDVRGYVDVGGYVHMLGWLGCHLPRGTTITYRRLASSMSQPDIYDEQVDLYLSAYEHLVSPTWGCNRVFEIYLQEVDGGHFYEGRMNAEVYVQICTSPTVCYQDVVHPRRLWPLTVLA